MKLICKVEIELRLENKCKETKEGRGGGMNWEMWIDIYTLQCIKQIINEKIEYSAELYSMLGSDFSGKKMHKLGLYVYVWMIHFAIQQKLNQVKQVLKQVKKEYLKQTFQKI